MQKHRGYNIHAATSCSTTQNCRILHSQSLSSVILVFIYCIQKKKKLRSFTNTLILITACIKAHCHLWVQSKFRTPKGGTSCWLSVCTEISFSFAELRSNLDRRVKCELKRAKKRCVVAPLHAAPFSGRSRIS